MSSLKQLHYVDERTKLTVYGWIRSISKCHNWSNFPLSEIASISILYFFKGEAFKNIDNCMRLSEDKSSVTKNSRGNSWDNSSYGSLEIASTDKCICEWEILIKNPSNKDSGIVVGVASKEMNYSTSSDMSDGEKCYLFGNWGNINDGTNINCFTEYLRNKYPNYSEHKQNNSRIWIHLDLNKREIRFTINNTEGPIAFKDIQENEDTKYKLVVTAFHPQAKIEIVSFQRK